MYTVYFIVSSKTNYLYIGMTSKQLSVRMAQHRHAANKGKKSPLYNCMRKHGVENFMIATRDTFETKEECQQSEKDWITLARKEDWKLLNLADGGEGGYVVPEHLKDEWRAKLSKARQGRKPALGMRHTEENKKFFAECNKRKVPNYPNLDFSLGFTKNNKLYGISKTHYYRLLKRAKSNELG